MEQSDEETEEAKVKTSLGRAQPGPTPNSELLRVTAEMYHSTTWLYLTCFTYSLLSIELLI